MATATQSEEREEREGQEGRDRGEGRVGEEEKELPPGQKSAVICVGVRVLLPSQPPISVQLSLQQSSSQDVTIACIQRQTEESSCPLLSSLLKKYVRPMSKSTFLSFFAFENAFGFFF